MIGRGRSRQFFLAWASILILAGLLIELVSLALLRSPIGFLTFAIGSGALTVCGVLFFLRAQAADIGPKAASGR